MEGSAAAPAAGTVLNALANGTGAAFAIDAYVTATVTLTRQPGVTGQIAGIDGGDTRLIERCVQRTLDQTRTEMQGGTVRTESEIPMAAGLKSSSAAANATVLSTLAALGETDRLSRTDATRVGVQTAREVGVTVTGAFDDASASMLGGLTVTDNETDELLAHEQFQRDVLVWTPPERAYSIDADHTRCRRLAPIADLIVEQTLAGNYERAMTINGLAFCGALGFSSEPIMEGLKLADGVSLSGTGPSFTAVGEKESLVALRDHWESREGETWLTQTQSNGAMIDD